MPEKSQTISVAGYDAARLQAIAYGALEQLSWTIKYAGDNILIGYTPKSWTKYDNEITVNTEDNQLTVTSKMIHGEAFDMMGRNKKFITEFLAAFETVKAKATDLNTGEWNGKIELLKGETIKIAEQEIKQAEEADKVMNLSKGNLYLTYGIIGINVLLFVLMVASGMSFIEPKPWEVLKWGGSFPAIDLNGDWWRAFTSMFLHFGIIHLALNMYALYSVGVYLEPMLGKPRYIAAYLSSGLLASMLSIYWRKDDLIVGAGASGAIFGMYGVFLALLTTNVIPKQVRKTMLQSILIFVAYNVFYGFKPGSGIDNAAHLGGLISGILIGYIYYLSLKKPSEKKTQTITGLIALGTIIILYSFFSNQHVAPMKVDFETGKITSVANEFEEKYQQFGLVELKAVSPEEDSLLTTEQQLEKFEKTSIPAWEEAGKIADEMKILAKTKEQTSLAATLIEYVGLRKQLTALRIRTIKESTDQYEEEKNKLTREINNLLKENTEAE